MGTMRGREVAAAGGLAREEHPILEGPRQRLARSTVSRQGVAVGPTNVLHPAPVRSQQRMQGAARVRAEQRTKLPDGEIETRGRTILLDEPGPLAAEKTLDQR